MSRLLYHFAAPVKPARRFGAGVLRSLPSARVPFTASDLAWLAADNARREDEHFDRMAGESAALDRLESGLCC